MKFSQPHAARLPDPTAQAVRAAQDRQIQELQDKARELLAVGGRYLGRQTLTGSGTYTPRPGTRRVKIRGAAAGGGGGGATAGAAGGGGASGAYIETEIASSRDITGGAFTGGIPGTGGSTAGGNGTAGGDATLVINGTTITLKGGLGGQGLGAGLDGAAAGGGTQAGSTTGAMQSPGEPSIRWNGGAAWLPGSGGQTPISGEARAFTAGAAAPAATGFGAGGAGGFGSGAVASAGGAPSAGGWIIEEYT